jgi:hypothetical protein
MFMLKGEQDNIGMSLLIIGSIFAMLFLGGCVFQNSKPNFRDTDVNGDLNIVNGNIYVNGAIVTGLDANGDWDGGFANSVYLPTQYVDGGNA